MALLQFYNEEKGALSEWWLPMANLINLPSPTTTQSPSSTSPLSPSTPSTTTPTSTTTNNNSNNNSSNKNSGPQSVLASLRSNSDILANVYARNIVLSFFSHSDNKSLSLVHHQVTTTSHMDTKNILFLASREYEKIQNFNYCLSLKSKKKNSMTSLVSNIFSDTQPIDKILGIYQNENDEDKKIMCDIIVKECVEKLKQEIAYITTESIYISKKSTNNTVLKLEKISLHSAHSVIVMCDKSETKIHSSIQSGIYFICLIDYFTFSLSSCIL
jgi:hypothetical protein